MRLKRDELQAQNFELETYLELEFETYIELETYLELELQARAYKLINNQN
jgi:hypothetical protein